MSEKHIENEGRKLHWPTIFLGIIIASIFLVVIFSYQLKSTEFAIVDTFGKVQTVDTPGLKFRLPYPIQKIYYFDKRDRCFEGSVGRIEETYTADGQNIIVGIYVRYRIVKPARLFKSEKTIKEAEELLNSLMRSDKDRIIGKYTFSQFINSDPGKMKIVQIENEIKDLLKGTALNKFGLEILSVKIKNLSLPEAVTKDVIERMKKEREAAAQKFLSEGDKLAVEIKARADQEKENILSIAKAKAKMIRAEGDAKAAVYYSVFKEEPELAIFLKKLDALRNIVKSKTVLVLDTDTAPFDLLKPNAEKLSKEKH